MRFALALLLLTGCTRGYDPPVRYIASTRADVDCGERADSLNRQCFEYASSDASRDACVELGRRWAWECAQRVAGK